MPYLKNYFLCLCCKVVTCLSNHRCKAKNGDDQHESLETLKERSENHNQFRSMMQICRDVDAYDYVCKKRKIKCLRICCKKSIKLALRWVGTLVVPGSVGRNKLYEPKKPLYDQTHNALHELVGSEDEDWVDLPEKDNENEEVSF